MDPVSAVGFGLSAFSAVVQLYQCSVTAYNLYLDVKDFPPTYIKLRLGLEIERQRLELWARQTIHNQDNLEIDQSSQHSVLWNLFKDILTNMMNAFEGGTRSMEEYEHYAGFLIKPTSAGSYDGYIAASAHEISGAD
jgi:hypothetical protein